jgi:hypothetical protein
MGAIAGAVIGIIGSLAASDAQASSAEEAARLQAGGASAGSAIQHRQFQTIRNDQAPWRSAGEFGINRLASLLGRDTRAEEAAAQARLASQTVSYVDPFAGHEVFWRDPGQRLLMNSSLYESNPQYRQVWDQANANVAAKLGMPDGEIPWYADQMIEEEFKRLSPSQKVVSYNQNPVVPEGRTSIIDGPRSQQSVQGGDDIGGLLRQFSSQDLQNDPIYQASYQAGLESGRKSLGNQFNAAGMGQSGGAAKAMSRFAIDYTAQRGNEAFNRWNAGNTNTFNRLASLSGIGQTAANQTSAAASNLGNNLTNLTVGNANAQAASQIAQGNAQAGALGNIGNWWNQYQMSQTQQPVAWQQTYANNPYMSSGGSS